jgi:effector-binding domain-containing protein
MKTLRLILVIFLCLVLAVLSVGFLLPGKVQVERSLLISAKPESLFEQVNTPKHWKKWSPWLQSDTSMVLSYSGPEKGAGAILNWQSKDTDIGKGKVHIISVTLYDSLLVILDFGDSGKTSCIFLFEEIDNGTMVTWRLESDLGLNPVSRWIGLFTERIVAPDLETGLMNLNRLASANKLVNGFEITDFEVPAKILLTIRDTSQSEMVGNKLALMYEKISRFIKKENLSPAGPPMTIYHSFSLNTYDFETCIPILSVVPTPEGINCIEMHPQRVVMVKYFGTRSLITNAYSALQSYLNNNGLYTNGPSWEEYITNPKLEADTMVWQTNIYNPVK